MPYYANRSQSANVYLREIDLSHRIAGASTTIGAVVGFARKGPVMVPTLVTDTRELISLFGVPHPSQGFMLYSALAFLKQSASLYVVRSDTHALTAGAFVTVDDPTSANPIWSMDEFNDGAGNALGVYSPMTTVGYIESDPMNANNMFFVTLENPGEWNNSIFVSIKPSNPAGFAPGIMNDSTEFFIEVFENYLGVNDYPLESFKVCRSTKMDGNGNPMFIEDVVNKKSKYIRVRNNPYSDPNVPVTSSSFVFMAGGTDGNPINNISIMNGWDLFVDPEEITANIFINAGYTDPGVQTKMAEIAARRMDAIAVLDIPSSEQQVSDAINYRRVTLNLNSSYAALYCPDVEIYDRYNDMSLFVPPSGYAAAAMAYTDRAASVFFAPAGISRGTLAVDKIKFLYNQSKRDALNDAQINMIRRMPAGSYAIWNQSTLLSTPSALQSINVRRLMNYIEKSISTSVVSDLFDPNDDTLRTSIVIKIQDFLQPIKAAGGLYAYVVVCNSSNNTPDIIANGDLVVDVIIDAESVLPVKRLLLRATINRTGSRVTL